MKVIMKPIQVYALWRENGVILPMAFCLENQNEAEKRKIAVTEVSGFYEERRSGKKMIYFHCHTAENNRENVVSLCYDIAEHRWYLHKA